MGSVLRSGLELLYEQCSLHITLNMASSVWFGSRPSFWRIASSSPSVTPSGDGAARARRRRASAPAAAERSSAHRAGSRPSVALGRRPAAPLPSAALSTSERISCMPSSVPRMASDIRSGCGISPATLPAALHTPAMARSEPFGLAGSSGSSAGVPSSRT